MKGNTITNASEINTVYYVSPGDSADLLDKLSLCQENCEIKIPYGIYLINSSIILNNDYVSIVGIGKPILRADNTFSANTLIHINGSYNSIKNIIFDSNNLVNETILLTGTSNTIYSVSVQRFLLYGFHSIDGDSGPYYNAVYDLTTYSSPRWNNTIGLYIDHGSNALNIYGGRV